MSIQSLILAFSTGLVEFLKRTIRAEISAMVYKIFLGIILTSTIAFSVIQAEKAMQKFLGQFQDGYVVELFVFSILSIVALIMLYLLFNTVSSSLPYQKKRNQKVLSILDWQNLVGSFVAGFASGLVARKNEPILLSERQKDHSR